MQNHMEEKEQLHAHARAHTNMKENDDPASDSGINQSRRNTIANSESEGRPGRGRSKAHRCGAIARDPTSLPHEGRPEASNTAARARGPVQR